MERYWLQFYPEGVPYDIDPDQYQNLIEMLEEKVQKMGSHKAVTCLGSSLTFKEIDLLSTYFAAYLQQELALKAGDRLAIMMPNCLQYLVAIFGAFKAGLIVVNVNPLYTPSELVYQLLNSGTQSIVVLNSFAHTVMQAAPQLNLQHVIISTLGSLMPFPKRVIVNFIAKYIKGKVLPHDMPGAISLRKALSKGKRLKLAPVDVAGEDIAFLQYTGGTTGVSKGAILTHRNVVANILQGTQFIKNSFAEGKAVFVLPLPLYHIYALTMQLGFLHMGGETILIVNPRDTHSFVSVLKKGNYDCIVGLNTLFHNLLNDKKFRNLKFPQKFYTFAGGMATKESVAKKWEAVTGSPIANAYGLTEASPGVSFSVLENVVFNGSVGLPVPSLEIEIRDGEGKSLGMGEAGELCVKGPNVTQGYWKCPEENATAFTEDGWFKTGDIAVMNSDGTLTILDRKKDMIIVGGFNVYPNEVEEVLLFHPGILEAAVVGEPDEHSGEVVKAYIVKKDLNLTIEDVKSHCKKFLAGYKRPSLIVFRKELPKSVVGKVLRAHLREGKQAKGQEWRQAA